MTKIADEKARHSDRETNNAWILILRVNLVAIMMVCAGGLTNRVHIGRDLTRRHGS